MNVVLPHAILLNDWCKLFNVPNPVPSTLLHTSIISSLDDAPYVLSNETITLDPKTYALRRWINERNQKNILVMLVDSEDLHKRHQYALSCGATHIYGRFVPHITLSYDVGDFDPTHLQTPFFSMKLVEERMCRYMP